jgi:bifunctional non-homologous end joining protein LigD
MAANKNVTVKGRQLELSNLDKVFYPQTGFTKAQTIDYYRRVAPHILPHLRGRPIVLKRYPEGVAGESFYEKTCPAHHPAWLATSGGRGGIDPDLCLIEDLPSLIWVANLAAIEIHTLLARTMERYYPDRVISRMTGSLRAGKVLVDWSQNTEHKTTVCVYSLRARAQPTVSMPVSWDEVEDAAAKKDAGGLMFSAEQALERLDRQGDPFAPVLTLKQELPTAAKTQDNGHAASGKGGAGDSLRAYRRRRNFARTPEPRGDEAARTQAPVFVIRKHAARQVHYDLRIEAASVLKSWSVPRGPSSDPKDRRLAVMTEDHPLAYRDFEGTIPRGQYGAGKVLIWDRGTYRNITDDANRPTPIEQAIDNGKVEVFLEGSKVRGGYVLIRMDKPDEKRRHWLLIKLRDEYVGFLPADLDEQPRSVATGRTAEDLDPPSRPK